MSYRLRAGTARKLIWLGRARAWRYLVGALQIAFGAGSRRMLQLAPLTDLEPVAGEPGAWVATGSDPALTTRDLYLRIPKGWCYIDACIVTDASARAAVYVDRGKGFESEPVLEQETDSLEGARGVLRIPATAVALRLDPLDRSGPFQLGSVSVTQAALGVQLARALRPLWRRVRGAASRVARGARAAGRLLVLRPAAAAARWAAGAVLALRPGARARALGLEPERQLAPIPGRAGRWHALGTEPRFRLTGADAPRGWCRLTTRVSADAPAHPPQLIARLRGDREVDLARRLTVAESGRVDGRVYVPVRATGLLWDPVGGPGEFEHAPTLELRPITAFPVADQEGEPAAAGADSRPTSTGSSTSTPARY